MGKNLMPMVLAVVLAVLLSVGAAYLLLGSQRHVPAAAAAEQEKEKAHEPELSEEMKPLSLDTFTTNLADSDKHFIQVTFVLLPKDEKTLEKLNAAKPVLRDAVLTILRTRTLEQVRGAEGKQNLVEAVQARLEELAGKGAVQRVLVTDLVVQ